MPQPTPGANPAAPAPAANPGVNPPASPAPGVPAQPTPGAAAPQATPPQPGVTPAPAATPPSGMVPLPALQEERSRRQALEAEVEQLKRMHTAPQPTHVPVQPGIAPVDPKVELDRLWDTDPRKAVQVEIMYAMDWRDRVDANLNVQADQLASRYSDFNNYRSSALGYIRTLPAHQRSAPGIMEAAYFMVRGQNVDQMRQQWESEMLAKYQRGEITAQQLQVPTGSFSTPPPTGQTQLNAEQLKVAEMMGLTPDQYASQIKLAPGGR